MDGPTTPARAARRQDHAARCRSPGTGGRRARPLQPRRRDRRYGHLRRRLWLQLNRPGPIAVLVCGTLSAAVVVRSAHAATAEGSARVTVFDEPSDKNRGVTVVHPQADVSATVASTFNIAAGYSADVVT